METTISGAQALLLLFAIFGLGFFVGRVTRTKERG
jgi:hypothetical protein